jgi:drug/metabolite transporter (DMT)-like permease
MNIGIFIFIACILLNTYVGIVFKFFEKYEVSNKQAIAFNYWVCVITGIVFSGVNPISMEHINAAYFQWGLFNGFFYFVIFILIAKSTIINGIATTQVANRLSFVIPVILLVFLYSEPISVLKIVGILLAMAAVFFTSYSKTKDKSKSFILPIIIFLGSGLLDFVASSVQRNFLTNSLQSNAFLIICFSTAAVCSSIYLFYLINTGREKFAFKNIIAGVILGLPNYFSIYMFIRALDSKILKSTSLIPVNNISVVLISTVIAIMFFHEKLNKAKLAGIFFAIVAIGCIVFSELF